MKTRIKEYRAKEGLSQKELAEAVGVRRETIVFLEKGKYNPSLRLAWNISKTLRADIENLFDFNDFTEPSHKNKKTKEVRLSELHKYI